MFMNIYSIFISVPLMFGSSFLIFFSNSWFSQWMLMEINLIGFLSLILFEKESDVVYLVQYYLLQSILSFMFLFFINNLYFLNKYYLNLLVFMINLILFSKIGMPPFFLWYFSFCKNLSWMNLFFMFTIQKVIPLLILLNLNNLIYNDDLLMMILFIIIIIASTICSLLSINVSNLKMLMTYSSVIQMSWLLILMILNENYFLMYFLIYFLILLPLIMVMNKFNFLELNSLSMLFLNKNWLNLILMVSMISLAGIPPFFGFLLKWFSLYLMSSFLSFYLMFLLIMNSLISIFFYLRLMFLMFFYSNFSIKLNYFMIFNKLNFTNFMMFMFILNMFGLLIYEIF